ncbi:Aldo/keto reductase [Exidia glandulosa HHB12029]|uniref:Aldo/keto reductase n=1 Tax=Exidia glandulosa HHB12029 TaxID=1314781 RepID=A0A165CZT3_EXIGL|nr:Aldo/keto reductase [Exidia glandulosa HHB12029]
MSTRTVQYRQLGKSGLRVSVPIVGAMSFGHPAAGKWIVPQEKGVEILKAAWDRGVTTIDTANVYSNGYSEITIAAFMEKYNIPRNKILIFTKCFGMVPEDPAIRGILRPDLKFTRDYVNQHGLSRAAIFNAVDASLKRLRTDYIDLLQIHRFDPETPPEEIMKALHDLVQSGKVRYIGASSMRTWQFALLNDTAEKHGWTKFVSMQNEYSLLYREEEREMIPYCNYNGIGLIPWGPLQAGTLARPLQEGEASARVQATKGTPFELQHSDADKEIVKRVEELAKKKGWTMSEVALAWINKRVSSPIVGVSSAERLEQAMITGYELTEEDEKYLEEPYVPKKVRGHA